jgi:hypothetical protein
MWGVWHDGWCVIRGGEGGLQRRGRRGWAAECGALHSLFDSLRLSSDNAANVGMLACAIDTCMLCYFGIHSGC